MQVGLSSQGFVLVAAGSIVAAVMASLRFRGLRLMLLANKCSVARYGTGLSEIDHYRVALDLGGIDSEVADANAVFQSVLVGNIIAPLWW